MRVKYKKTKDGKIIRITKDAGRVTEEEISEEEYEKDETYRNIGCFVIGIIALIIIISSCAAGSGSEDSGSSSTSSSSTTSSYSSTPSNMYTKDDNEDEENEVNENEDDSERTFYYMPDSNNNDDEENEEELSGGQLDEIIDEIRYINKQYKQIHNESWTVVKADFQRYIVDYEHVDIMDTAYMDYDELSHHAEVVMERVKDINIDNKENLNQYLENIKEASVAKGYASMYYSYMISDAVSGYAEDPSDENTMYDYLFEADEYQEKALENLKKFEESNGIEI